MIYSATPKEVYNALNSSPSLLDIYSEIEKREAKNGGWAFHNYEHVKNVSQTAEKILADLHFDEDTIYACKIACLLHDVGALQGKEGHSQRSFEYAKKLFEEKNWIFEMEDVVLDAIQNHSSGFESDNIVLLSILLADKLDIQKTRISEEGKKIRGNRQYQHIEDIIADIQDGTLTIHFITDGKMEMEEVNDYYFTAKVFKAIKAFSERLHLKHLILMDDKPWSLA